MASSSIPARAAPAGAEGGVEAPSPTGVLVLGMHRSGTSATTRAVNLTGVPVAEEEWLKRPSRTNRTGFWEVPTLTQLNDRLLRMLGGWWSSPPPPSADPTSREVGEELRAEARTRFSAVHRDGHWVWKDPRNCLTLPFWIETVGLRPAAVFVHRDPNEAARSVAARNGFTEELGLALWERYNRSVITALAGKPVFVLTYRDLLERPQEVVTDMASFLRGEGVAASPPEASALEFLSERLRTFSERPTELSASQAALHEKLLELRGAQAALGVEALPPETHWVEPLFANLRWARELGGAAETRVAEAKTRAEEAHARAARAETRAADKRRQLRKARRKVEREEARTEAYRQRLARVESSLGWRAQNRLSSLLARAKRG